MNGHAHTLALQHATIPVHGTGLLQRACACGQHTWSGECETCKKKGTKLQRQAQPDSTRIEDIPSSVHETLRSPGQSLDAAAQSYMEPRFGHDFSGVRVHTDRKAAESAQAVGALAYTVGRNIVFDAGQYAPHTSDGRRLLAHELTHVIQQGYGVQVGMLQRQPRPAPVDAAAQRIINLAQDSRQPIGERAVAVVRAIINEYFSQDAPKVSGIEYDASARGLHTTSEGRGANTTGRIGVGDYFVQQTDQRNFARRVLQVRHELEHIDQYRAGMTGENRSDEREFIAHFHGAVAQELPGTGRVQLATRVNMIDGALGYFYCLSEDLQHANLSRRDELMSRRQQEVRASGHADLGSPPTSCTRAEGRRR
jgi:hypothetical protein